MLCINPQSKTTVTFGKTVSLDFRLPCVLALLTTGCLAVRSPAASISNICESGLRVSASQ
jgi:hypothetical protein